MPAAARRVFHRASDVPVSIVDEVMDGVVPPLDWTDAGLH
jgi:hypothetical protein